MGRTQNRRQNGCLHLGVYFVSPTLNPYALLVCMRVGAIMSCPSVCMRMYGVHTYTTINGPRMAAKRAHDMFLLLTKKESEDPHFETSSALPGAVAEIHSSIAQLGTPGFFLTQASRFTFTLLGHCSRARITREAKRRLSQLGCGLFHVCI